MDTFSILVIYGIIVTIFCVLIVIYILNYIETISQNKKTIFCKYIENIGSKIGKLTIIGYIIFLPYFIFNIIFVLMLIVPTIIANLYLQIIKLTKLFKKLDWEKIIYTKSEIEKIEKSKSGQVPKYEKTIMEIMREKRNNSTH